MGVIEICSDIAKRGYLWVQGAGGNVSVKKGNQLWIKPSGFRLDEIFSESDLACVDLEKIKSGLRELKTNPIEETYAELLIKSQILSAHRPSMETGFHALLPELYVAHFHSLVSVLMVQEFRKNEAAFLHWYDSYWKSYMGELVILPLVMPGLLLSLQLDGTQPRQVILLENHGVILQGSTEIDLKQFSKMEKDFCLQLDYKKALPFLEQTAEPNLLAPLRFYFPDFAIVFDKLFPHLEEVGGEYRPKTTMNTSYLEIWRAHCFLVEVSRNLPELPQDFVDQLVTLPTEKYRREKVLR